MNVKTAIVVLLVLSAFLAGCASNQEGSGYAGYNQPQQNQYAGGGCGVAPNAAYESTPVEEINSAEQL
ncbi:hypothetical protein HYX08_06420 [Candidatus Woesearchaeota archaeon]|nr:hypothetical protein [Candidatus Woesearchaeota archaeon]